MMIRKSSKDIALDTIFILIGTALGAFAITGIMIPNGLSCGGLTGITRIIQQYVNFEFSIIYYVLAGIVFLLVTVFLGFKESKKLIIVSVTFPTMVLIFEKLNISLLDEKDLMLAAIYCGVLLGLSYGCIFWRGFASGGSDSIAQVIKRRWVPYIDTSRVLFIVDGIVIVSSGLVFDKNIALYALVTQYISMKMTDTVLYGFSTKLVQLDIITNIPDEVKDFVLLNVARGVSSFEIKGEYTGVKRKQLVVICSPRESMLIKRFLAEKDPQSMVRVTTLNSVWGTGRGFRQIDKEDII